MLGFHPDDLPALAATRAAVFERDTDASSDCRWRMPDGTERWIHARVHAAERDADGVPTVLAGTLQDITDRMTIDLSLRETLSLLNATLDSTADGILVVDLNGVVTTVNGRFVDMWGLPPELGMSGINGGAIVDAVLPQLKEADVLWERTQDLDRTPDADSHDVVEFTDGRVFERYSTPQRVGGQIVGRVWTCRDVTEHKRLQDELAHQAFHDPLTGLANQALFRALVEHAVARISRTHTPMAVLFIDLDDFKTVNDSLGHTIGDELLIAVSERLASCVRPADTAARLGGDEFAVLIEEATSLDDAVTVAGRMIDALRRPFTVSGKELYASASIGIAYGQVGTDGDQLMRNADLAMYTAKRRGRHRFEVYEPDMHAAVVERLELEADLRGAVERGEMIVHYQPIIDLIDGGTVGVEALARWTHPTRGLIAPDSFIPIAEDTDLITEIGLHVLAVACAQAKVWRAEPGTESLLLTVNLSPRQLLDEHVVARVEEVLADTGLPPEALVLEITEGAMVQDTELAIERL
jgi:diguanylate cyclase (GGDEF)-like protein/PAS domain S-box-containing protein